MPSRRNSKSMGWLPSRTKQDPILNIQIDGHYQSKIYTSGSTVSGQVTVSSQHDIPYQTVQVILTGTTSTANHALQYGDPVTTHLFLKTSMPVPEAALPITRILEAGQPYHIPFTFVVPYELSGPACRHQNMAVWGRHLQPPPSMGSWGHDDLAGGSVRVEYAIKARLVLGKEEGGKQQHLENIHSFKVIPLFPEQPPIHISPSNSGYCFSQSKTVRKNLVGPKVGSVSASASQPNPIILCLDKLQSSESQVPIHLEFTPASTNHTPPDIRIKSAAIDVFTDYWLGSTGYLPDQHDLARKPGPKAPWLTSRSLALDKPERVTWERRQQFHSAWKPQMETSESVSMAQNDLVSMISTDSGSTSTCDDVTTFKSTPIYKASLLQSFRLPTGKSLFLPTFYSCLVSRTYKLQLTLTVGGCSSICLTLPLQIAVGGCDGVQSADLPCYTPPEGCAELTGNLLPPYCG